MTTKFKTRLDAKKASTEKWTEINKKLLDLANDVEGYCGFCRLAKNNVPESEGEAYIHKCRYCEPDAQKLCEEYITADDRLIVMGLHELQELTSTLLSKIKALPDVYEEK